MPRTVAGGAGPPAAPPALLDLTGYFLPEPKRPEPKLQPGLLSNREAAEAAEAVGYNAEKAGEEAFRSLAAANKQWLESDSPALADAPAADPASAAASLPGKREPAAGAGAASSAAAPWDSSKVVCCPHTSARRRPADAFLSARSPSFAHRWRTAWPAQATVSTCRATRSGARRT